MPDRVEQALAGLMPFLQCGEESAGMVFDGWAAASQPEEQSVFAAIAREEQMHEQLLDALARTLPTVAPVRRPSQVARFYIGQHHAAPAIHAARVASLDSAVCLLLNRLAGRGSALRTSPETAGVFLRIARDEARHVRLSRSLAAEQLSVGDAMDQAVAVRLELADLLAPAAPLFEALGVEPDRLLAAISQVSRGLFQ